MVSVSGNLSDTQLDHLLTLLTIRATSGRISFYRGGQEGILYIKSGHVVHAESGTLRGAQAFLRIATWKDADFVLDESNEEPPAQTISSDIDLLVLESQQPPLQEDLPPAVISAPVEPPIPVPTVEAQPVPAHTVNNDEPACTSERTGIKTESIEDLAAVAEALAILQVYFSDKHPEVKEQIRIAKEAIDRAVELVRAEQAELLAAETEPQIPDLPPVLPVEKIDRPPARMDTAHLRALIEELETRQYNGYISWKNPTACGYLVLAGGHIRSALYRSATTRLYAQAALARLVREAGAGETGVMTLDLQVAPAVAALLTAPVKLEHTTAPEMAEQKDEAGGIVFRKVDPRIARVQELLLELRAEKFSGALRVSGNEHSGVILLSNGRSLGLYTGSVPNINTAPLGTVMSLLNPIILSSDGLIAIHALPPAEEALELDAKHE